MTDSQTELFREHAYVGGRWIDAADQARRAVDNPASGETIGHIPDLEPNRLQGAIDAADAAFTRWRETPVTTRADKLLAWYDGMQQNREALAQLMTREQGKPIAEARGEVDYAASFIRWFAEEGRRSNGVNIPAENADMALGRVEEPVGVVGVITPWNFPLAMITRKAAAALAAGCSVVVKPASETPFSALALAALAEQAGLDDGQFNVVTGDAERVSKALCDDPRVRALSFTGSTPIGRQLLRDGAATVKRMSMELGGNAPFIVCEDADLDSAVDSAIAAKFQTSGQDCVAANRLFVHRDLYDAFVDRFVERMNAMTVGNGADEASEIGPLIHERAVEKAQALADEAESQGARVFGRAQAKAPGPRYFMPTLLADITPDMRIFSEEAFAPLAAVCAFDDDDDVIAQANDTEYGLAAYVHTHSDARIRKFMRALDYGMVGVNTMDITGPHVPFGGMKQSGLGREGAHAGMQEYLETKYYCLGGVPV
ncbi:NAD-dependent succinate-semialdehyde dehydrogenase [uncultured Salinisphaera sp.]|uniref:NAD-dependent succinate-semialdehyde dehydrogenase n=1 Tax=uncultured Salinisphaera sp. TaxID=359372 RepID=UPI0032B0FD86|tara:strand:+ start:1427 stop:2884 length:1458 start_codon:yes stop_codon:yes gene_type:complete